MERSIEDKAAAVELISKKIIQTAINTMLLEMRYMDVALAKLTPKPLITTEYLATNGEDLYYNQVELIRRYKINPNQTNHDLMHLLLHCVFKHLFYKRNLFPNFDLCCDIVIEEVMSTFESPSLKVPSLNDDKNKTINYFKDNVKPFTPHNLANFMQSQNYTETQIKMLNDTFEIDSHDLWHELQENKKSKGKGVGDGDGDSEEYEISYISWEDLEKAWGNVGETVDMNLISFNKQQGLGAGGLQQQLKELKREPFDYTSFLKKFSQIQEVTKLNNDEFDYIFYTYGLNNYDNMPLIEPLEYKDSKIIKDFVIAIDTSGSTCGEIVQKFLQKTYNILKSTESFAKKINLFIIQCDTEIQEVVHIENEEQLENYIANLTIKGLGGTDFRPVFAYMNELIKEKAFDNLKGLLYFTDGYGTFPTQRTPYETVFVFIVKEDYENVTVPPWAMKVLLTEDEIIEFKQSEGY